MHDAGIVRNRLKIEATIRNARGYLQIQEEQLSFADYLWSYVDGRPVINAWRHVADVPAHTSLSDRLSKDLKKRGFNFVGTTICYSFMQDVGLVNDHTIDCYRHAEVNALGCPRSKQWGITQAYYPALKTTARGIKVTPQ